MRLDITINTKDMLDMIQNYEMMSLDFISRNNNSPYAFGPYFLMNIHSTRCLVSFRNLVISPVQYIVHIIYMRVRMRVTDQWLHLEGVFR